MPAAFLDQVPWWTWTAAQWIAALAILAAALRRVRRGRGLLVRLLASFVVFGALAAWVVGSLPSGIASLATGRVPTAFLRSPAEGLAAVVLAGSVLTAPAAVASWVWARARNGLPPEIPVAAALVAAWWAWSTRGAPGLSGLAVWTAAVAAGSWTAWFLVEGLDRLHAGQSAGPSPGFRRAVRRVAGLAGSSTARFRTARRKPERSGSLPAASVRLTDTASACADASSTNAGASP